MIFEPLSLHIKLDRESESFEITLWTANAPYSLQPDMGLKIIL
jgi:hypothetical protein